MLEHRSEPVVSTTVFAWRMAFFVGMAFVLIATALGMGVAGYHWIGRLSLVDSVLNASMILTGMGPVDKPPSSAAKLFASAYAIFSGLVFITVVGVLLTPVVHRIMHRFHVDDEETMKDASQAAGGSMPDPGHRSRKHR